MTWRAPREETLNGELKEFEIRWRKGREDPTGGGCVEAASGRSMITDQGSRAGGRMNE